MTGGLGGGLKGVRVLVTRPAGRASGLAELLRAEGAEAVEIPTIELAAPASWCALDAALVSLRAYDWLLLTSATAAEAMVARARVLGVPHAARRVAVIGPATAKAVLASGLAAEVDLMPERYVAEAMAEALEPYAAGKAMLLVRAAEARDVLPERLAAAGAQVTIAAAYRNVVPAGAAGALRRLFAETPPDAITFTSASTARNLVDLLEEAVLALPAGVVLASIGPVTTAAMRELGLTARVEAAEATLPALVAALRACFAGWRRGVV